MMLTISDVVKRKIVGSIETDMLSFGVHCRTYHLSHTKVMQSVIMVYHMQL